MVGEPNLEPEQNPANAAGAGGEGASVNPQADAPIGAEAPKPPMKLGDKLIGLGVISKDQLQVALQEQSHSKKLLGAILVDFGFITESTLGQVLADSAGTQKFDPKSAFLDIALVRQVPKDLALRHKLIPVTQTADSVQVAMADIYNVLAIDQIKRCFPRNMRIVPVYCAESDVLEMIDQYYEYEMSLDGILKEIESGGKEKAQKLEVQEGYVNPTVRFVNALLVDAIRSGASDVHIEPEGYFVRVRYRLDGQLTQIKSFHRDYWAAILVRIKIMSGMNIAESRNPQDGRISSNALGREVDFRVSTLPTVHGENVVLRLLDKRKALVPLDKLGFSEHNDTLLKKLIKRPEGIIVVTGPTGSGKTTTLYSILSYINSMDINIMTLEDPVEYQLPLIRQTQVREGSGVDFASGIKALLRQDPDVIFVGEVRDEETAIMAVRSALTGHQVYSTLHTNDALGAIPRLVDIGVPRHLLVGTLICSIAQRLARKLCPHCRKMRKSTPEECKLLGVNAVNPPYIYDAGACPKCNFRGYKGRVAILEILPIDKGMDELIYTNASRNTMMDYALKNGFVSMGMDGINKVLAGDIDLPELIGTIDFTDKL